MKAEILIGNCLDKLKELVDNSIDSIVTDPPYGLSFMGKKWDYDVPSVEVWQECLRVLKPGGHLLSFAGARTYHRMAVNIEDAGFEIRDQIMWVYGSGFPKSLNIGKAVDKKLGNKRIDLGTNPNQRLNTPEHDIYEAGVRGKKASITKGESEWEGWGTALKPAHEPIVMARKPLSEKTIAENVLKHGTGGINIDGCRVEYGSERVDFTAVQDGNIYGANDIYGKAEQKNTTSLYKPQGRFPANFIHDGSDEVVGLFPETKSGCLKPSHATGKNPWTDSSRPTLYREYGGDSGSAARFFYCPKANKKERNAGCENIEEKYQYEQNKWTENDYRKGKGEKTHQPRKNNHPTVKPLALMRYLCRLVTPNEGTILDPFMGSGTTGIAAKLEGFNFIGVEMNEDYCEIAKARIYAHKTVEKNRSLFTM